MTPRPTDLFGQIPVTQDEVEFWLDGVQTLSHLPWRRAYYAKWWNVVGKIQAAKLDGSFWLRR